MASIFARFFGRTVSDAAGFAAGVATGPALAPVLQEVVNRAWAEHPVRPPDAGTLAAGVAQGQVDEAAAREWARERGFGGAQMDALIAIANVGPGMAEAFRLYWRGEIGEAGFRRALKRLGLEDEWIDDLWNVREQILDPAQIATAVHRNIMRDPSLIVTEPPTAAGKVPQVPESSLDPATEAAGSGIDHERLRVLVGITGLPLALGQMLDLLNR